WTTRWRKRISSWVCCTIARARTGRRATTTVVTWSCAPTRRPRRQSSWSWRRSAPRRDHAGAHSRVGRASGGGLFEFHRDNLHLAGALGGADVHLVPLVLANEGARNGTADADLAHLEVRLVVTHDGVDALLVGIHVHKRHRGAKDHAVTGQ